MNNLPGAGRRRAMAVMKTDSASLFKTVIQAMVAGLAGVSSPPGDRTGERRRLGVVVRRELVRLPSRRAEQGGAPAEPWPG